MYPFAQESVLDRLAAGFRAAGVPSEEDGGIDHLPLHDGNKLSGAEIKSLLFDREIGGYDFWEGGSSWTQRRTAGGAVEHDGFPSHVGITGVTAGVGRIEDDMLCELWPEYNKTQEICVVIYRIPGGKFQWDPFKGATTLDYVMVTELGPHPFSPVE